MKNFNSLMLVSLFFCCQTFAQQIITEHKQLSGNSKVTHHHQKIVSEAEAISFDENTQVYMKAAPASVNQNSTDEVNAVTVQIHLSYPAGQYAPITVTMYDEGDNYFTSSGGSTTFTDVPPGVYDIVTLSQERVTYKNSYVIKEQVSITEDSVITIDLTEADNLMTIKFLDRDGNDLKPGIIDNGTGEVIGGTANVYATTYLYFEPKDWTPFINYYLWENSNGNVNEFWNFYVSDLSERYSFIHTNVGAGYDGEGYVSKYDIITNINASRTLQNIPSEWVTHENKFQPSVVGAEQGGFYHILSNWDIFKGRGLSGWSSIVFKDEVSHDKPFKINLNNADDDNPVDMLAFGNLEDYYGVFTEFMGEESFPIGGNALMLDENRNVVLGARGAFSGFYNSGYDYDVDMEGNLMLLPFHPKFSYTAQENPDIVFGSSTPFAITNYDGYFATISHLGNSGELRDSDIFGLHVQANRDGSTVFEGTYADFYFLEPFDFGKLEFTFTNENTSIEGHAGKTVTRLSVDADNTADNIPPSLQMLQFRNSDGKVTQKFGPEEHGVVMIAAGDYEYNPEYRSLHYKAGNVVELFYRQNGETDWNQLELTNYPEHFVEVGYGDYYEASLEGISATGNDVWYDVRIVSTDPAGNIQEQEISYAFKLNNTMNVSESDMPDFAIYPNPFSNELHISPRNLKGSFTFMVTDLSGRIIHSQEKRSNTDFVWNGASLPKGIYVLYIQSDSGIITKKIIKK